MVINFNSCLSESDFFERRYDQGYTEVAFGEEGKLIRDRKIVRLVVAYHPTRIFGEVATLQYPEFTCGTHADLGNPFEANYTEKGFRKYCRENKIPMSDRQDLSEILSHW
jgi:hypothetical protein